MKGSSPVVTERGLVTIVTTKEDVELATPLRLMLKVEGVRTQVLGSGLAVGEANVERIDGSVIVIFAPRKDPQPEALLAFSLALAERPALQRLYVTHAANGLNSATPRIKHQSLNTLASTQAMKSTNASPSKSSLL